MAILPQARVQRAPEPAAEKVGAGQALPLPSWPARYVQAGSVPPSAGPGPAASAAVSPSGPLPLAPVLRAPVSLQREEQQAPTTSAPTEATPPKTAEQTEAEEPAMDLNKLARQIYPIIKRLLAVERERLFTR